MADNLNAKARITLDGSEYIEEAKKIEDANKGIEDSAGRAGGAIEEFEGAVGGSAGQTDRAAGSARTLAGETEKVTSSTRGLASTRYALYDVANTWGIISAATLGAATAVEAVGANYEYAFSAVQRVTQTAGAEASEMKQDLKDLASTIHEEFDSIAEVATLGGQMGVAAEEIKEFTRNVTMFGATTSATVQEAATGFGRIAQMTKAGSDAWENIGSAIYQVGINSVATESQILRVAQEISTAGNLAGFTTDEVIGLSGALASLNIQPERARGNILRLFSELDKATADGGERLELFARNARMSADEFVQAWADTPEKAFRSLLEGMRDTADAGANLGQMIRDLGIINVRDVQTMQQLVNNTEVYVDAMGHANEAYREGTALLDAYGIRSDTVIGKLQILGNVVRNIMDSLSSTSAIKFLLDGLIEIGRAVENLLKNPVVSFFGTFGVALLSIVGVSAAVRSAMAAMQASILAITLAMHHLSAGVIPENRRGIMGLVAALGELNAVMKGTAVSSGQATAAIRTQTGATTQLATATNAATTAQGRNIASSAAAAAAGGRVASAFRTAGTAVTTLVGSLRFVPQLALISGALWAGSKAFNAWSERGEHAKNVAKEFFGTFDGLSDAIAEDTKTYQEAGEYMRLLGVNVSDGSVAWDSAALSQENLKKKIDETTESTELQIVAMGKATEEALRQSIMNSDNFAESWEKIKNAAVSAGVEIEDVVEGLKSGDTGFITGLVDQAEKDVDRFSEEAERLIGEVRALEEQVATAEAEGDERRVLSLEAELEKRRELLDAKYDALNVANEEVKNSKLLNDAMQGFAEIAAEVVGHQASANDFMEAWGAAAEEGADSTDELTDSLSGLFDELGRAHEAEDKMENLVHTLLENGTAIDSMTEQGRASFNALHDTISYFADSAGGDAWQFASDLANAWAYAEGAGIDLGNEVDVLHQTLANTFMQQWGLDLNTKFARDSIRAFLNDAIQAIKTRAELERQQVQANMAADPFALMNLSKYTKQISDIGRVANQQISQVESLKAGLSQVADRGAQAAKNFYNPPGRGRGGGGRKGGKSPIGKDAAEAAEEVRTLSDYVKDLGSVMKDAFQFRFGMVIATDDLEAAKRSLRELKEQSLDRVASAFDGLADARQSVLDLKVSLQDLNATVQGLEADRTKLQYFYEIAVEYGDTLRAEQIAAQLAKVNADLAKTENDRTKTGQDLKRAQKDVTEASKELSQAQKDAKRTLEGNTESAAEQRGAVLDLVRAYQDQIVELANSGLSQDQLKKKTAALKKEFEKELTQLGYNRAEIKKYGEAFKDITEIIKKVPRNITMKANMDPATRALNEWLAKNKNKSITVKTKATTPKIGSVSGGQYQPSSIYSRGPLSTSSMTSRGTLTVAQARVVAKGIGLPSWMTFSSGGYTGAGGMYDTAGTVHKGEYVFPKKDVNQTTGLPHADVLARMLVGTRGFKQMITSSSTSSAQGSMVALTPGTIQAIAQAVQPYLVINDKMVQQANGAANRRSTSTGAN